MSLAPATYDGIPWRSGSSDAAWATAGHVGAVFVSFLAPLVVLLVRGRRSGLVRQHAYESLNFQLTLLAAYLVGAALILVVIGLVLLFALWIANVVWVVWATLAARRGDPYLYPVSFRLFS